MINTILISIVLVMTTIVALIGMVWLIKNVRLCRASKKEDATGGISLKGEAIRRDTQGKENGCAVINYVSVSNEHTALSNEELKDEQAAADKYVGEVDGQIPGSADVRDDETNISMESPNVLSAESDEKTEALSDDESTAIDQDNEQANEENASMNDPNALSVESDENTENGLTPSKDTLGASAVKECFDKAFSDMRVVLINAAKKDNTYSKYAEDKTWDPLADGITSYGKMLECCKNVQNLVSGYEKCKKEELQCRFEEIHHLINNVMSWGGINNDNRN